MARIELAVSCIRNKRVTRLPHIPLNFGAPGETCTRIPRVRTESSSIDLPELMVPPTRIELVPSLLQSDVQPLTPERRILVGVTGLAPATSCFQSKRSSLSELHPVVSQAGIEPALRSSEDRVHPLHYREEILAPAAGFEPALTD